MNVAIVVAGGKGTRFGGNRPKQFLELNGTPVIIRTLRQFERCQEIENVVVVLPSAETAAFQSLAEKFGLKKVARVVAGGETRARSVQRGLTAIDQANIVAVHDGVRPLVTPNEIDEVVRAANASGAAVTVADVGDTIKQVESDRVTDTLPRENLRRALTPQCFRFEILKRAYDQLPEVEAANIDVTDDSYLVERLGVEIIVVEGSARNIKITQPEDMALAEVLLQSLESGVRSLKS